MSAEMFFSYIIPTIGRESLDFAVKSVLSQDFYLAEFEVIVVNDSGNRLSKAEWHQSPKVRIIDTYKCERCFARNSGAAVATGKYLAFLDDDDWILPGALEEFWHLADKFPDAVWLYGGMQVVDEKGRILSEVNSGLTGDCFAQIMGGAWVPIQASLVQAKTFFEIGGFNPSILGTEDEDLCRRTAYLGEFANTSHVVACLYRGETWHTSTNYLRAPEDVKFSRDLILSKPNVLRQLLASADSSYWYGRIERVYLSTVVWNLKKRRIFKAISRLLHSLAFFGLSMKYVFMPDYWNGLRADHVPDSLHFIMKQAYEENASPND